MIHANACIYRPAQLKRRQHVQGRVKWVMLSQTVHKGLIAFSHLFVSAAGKAGFTATCQWCEEWMDSILAGMTPITVSAKLSGNRFYCFRERVGKTDSVPK